MLTRPEHVEWLHFPSLEAELEDLRVGPLGSSTGSFDFDVLSYFASDNSMYEQLYHRNAESLTCYVVGLFLPERGSRVHFSRLDRLNLFMLSGEGILDTLDVIDTPVVSYICIIDAFLPISASADAHSAPPRFERIAPHLRNLDLMGNRETFTVTAEFLRGVTAPKWERLELSLGVGITETRDSSADDIAILVRIPAPTCTNEKPNIDRDKRPQFSFASKDAPYS